MKTKTKTESPKKTKKQKKTKKSKVSRKDTQKYLSSLSGKDLKRSGYVNSPFLKYSRLKPIERKYCSCLMTVRYNKHRNRDKDIRPYGVCIHNIYQRQGKFKSKTLDCSINYDFDNYHINYIKSFAKENKIPVTHVVGGKRVFYTKKELINRIRTFLIKKKVARQNSQTK